MEYTPEIRESSRMHLGPNVDPPNSHQLDIERNLLYPNRVSERNFTEKEGIFMSHIFDQNKFKKLDSPARRKALPPHAVINHLALTPNMTIADVGCGIGYFTFPFAKIVKQIYAIDISSIMINELDKRITTESNITTTVGNFQSVLDKGSMDLFFTATVIHELDNLDEFTRSAIDTLKTGGRLATLDFEKKESDFGPPIDKRISSETVEEMFRSNGLTNLVTHSINENFYLVIGTKSI